MAIQSYYVDKTSGTSADALLAVGFAELLKDILRGIGRPYKGILIRDEGPQYEVQIPTVLTEDDLRCLKPFVLVRPLFDEKKEAAPDKPGKGKKRLSLQDGFDYQARLRDASLFYERLKQVPAQYRTPEARLLPEFAQLVDVPSPVPELPHYQVINQMKITHSFNELAQRWLDLDEAQGAYIAPLLTLFRQRGNDLAAALTAWQQLATKGKASVTQLQVINPTTGKGSNRPKANGLTEGNPDNFWLLELLKFVGFFHAAAPYVIQGSKDRKTYVLQLQCIELSTLEGMMKKFRTVCWSSTAIKMDIQASLRFAQVFLKLREQALQGQAEEDDLSDEEQLYSIAQGFEVAFYKDMGSAYATMNVASINFPQWLPAISSVKEAEAAQQLLREHLTIIQQLRTSKGEEGAEEFELLRFYRDFLSGRDLKPFWRFTGAYSGYLISQREREKNPQRHIRQLTVNGLEHLVTMTANGKSLTTITSNPGFKRIAYAIRQSTVSAQYRRAQLRDRTYEVRYGLGQELMREGRYKTKFIVALSTFLHQYNAETAREEEKVANRLGHALSSAERRDNKLRGSVSSADIDQIVELVDAFDSETVCSLLVAYGYASDARRQRSESASSDADSDTQSVSSDEEVVQEAEDIEPAITQ